MRLCSTRWNVGGITASIDFGAVAKNSGGELTLRFEAPPIVLGLGGVPNDVVNSIMQSIAYENTNPSPPASVDLEWQFDDGNTGSQGTGGAQSTSDIKTVSIVPPGAASSMPSDLSSGIEINTDGTDAYLRSQSGLSQNLTETTVEIRFQADQLQNGTEPTFMSYHNGSEDEFSLMLNQAEGGLEIDFGPGGESNLAIANSIDYWDVLLDGDVHTLSVTWDNTNGDWAVYVDGEYVESGTGYNAGATVDTTTGLFVFGQEQDGRDSDYQVDQRFSGTIYDVRIWNEVRSDAEIALGHNTKVDSNNIPSSLVANWQMDGFSAGEVVDIVSGNNLSVEHVPASIDYTPGTAVESLNVYENASNGTMVGSVSASADQFLEDVVLDGRFAEQTISGSFQTFTSPASFGDWDVTNNQAVVYNDPASFGWTPQGGRPVELGNSAGPGTIEQTLNTITGQTYQLTFALTGDFAEGEATKDLRVTMGGNSTDFSIAEPDGWTRQDPVWDFRTIKFTATGPTTTLVFESLDVTGTGHSVIGDIQVVEVPAAVDSILGSDPTLSYDAATGKFYKAVEGDFTWTERQQPGSGSTTQWIIRPTGYDSQPIRKRPGSESGQFDDHTRGRLDWRLGPKQRRAMALVSRWRPG